VVKRRDFLIGTGAAVLGVFGWLQDQGGAAAAKTPARLGYPAAGRPAGHAVPSLAAAMAIAYARARVGNPYVYGGTGPVGYDCSGLVMMAYRQAGITLPRTSEDQWTQGHRVTSPQPGDLVFFPGSDGTWSAPGHVALVTGPGRIIQAYAPGTGIVATSYGRPGSLEGTGPGTVIGYTRPAA
jgi:peptidoglycan DL-endopeptidase CwlO